MSDHAKPKADSAVDHPAHYGGEDNPYEAIKVIEAWLGPIATDIACAQPYSPQQVRKLVALFHVGTSLKYLSRLGLKPNEPFIRDLEKARWYLDRAIAYIKEGK